MKNNSPHSRTKDLSETLIRSSFPNAELRLDIKKWHSPTFGWCFESTPKGLCIAMLYVFFTQCDECFYSLSGSGTLPGSENQLRPCPLCILLQPATYPLILVYQWCAPQTRPCLLHSCVWGNWFSSVSLLLQNGAPILSQGQGSRPYPTHVQLGLQRASSPCCGLSVFYWNSVSCMHTRIHSLCIVAPHNPSLKVLAVKGPLW